MQFACAKVTRWQNVITPGRRQYRSELFVHDSVEVPAVGDALQLVLPGVFERETGACHAAILRRKEFNVQPWGEGGCGGDGRAGEGSTAMGL